MSLAGIKVPDTVLVRDAIDLSRSASEPFLFNQGPVRRFSPVNLFQMSTVPN